jgi:hypothetical protein
MALRTYIVSTTDNAEGGVDAVAERLRQAGFVVERTLATIGIIVGRADDTRVAELRSLPGVGTIEEEHIVHLASRGGDDA